MIDAAWLRRLGRDGLAELMRRRSETVAAPHPRSLAELAERLVDPAAVIAVLRRLDLPTLQLTEALAALGGWEVPENALTELLGRPDGADIERPITILRAHALLWRSPDLSLVGPARTAFGRPLGLAPPAAVLLSGLTSEDVREIARRLGVRPAGNKAAIVAQTSEALTDVRQLEILLSTAPVGARELVSALAHSQRQEMDFGHFSIRHSKVRTPTQWAMSVGLLIRSDAYGPQLDMPAEVALALRGASYRAPFDPAPPEPTWQEVDPAGVTGSALGSAGEFLRLSSGLLDEVARAPLALLRTGGIGVRELRRLAKLLQAPAAAIRLAVAVAVRSGLLDVSGKVALLSERYDDWLRLEPAARFIDLLYAWWTLPQTPTDEPEAAWSPAGPGLGVQELRLGVLAAAMGEPAQAPVDVRIPALLATWRRPYGFNGADPVAAATLCWQEATLLGVVGAGAVSPIGRALLDGDDLALAASLQPLGSAIRSVRVQADLTAVVAGTPAADLAELLDAMAARESSGVATIWRFDPGSVRRALDAGHTAEDLLARLEVVASGPLPQPLRYLVGDVERRHGSVRACEVVCCLRSEDTALLAEVAADRRLRTLGLRSLAPTVLAGGQPLHATLAALRAAGYAPVAEAADGTVTVERAERRRGSPAAGR
nr:helicase-associated domain-containing protein [Geodermatophilaceae bacterium]